MEKILVPTDLTPTAETGLKLAIEISKRTGAVISLINFTKHPFGKTFTTTADVTVDIGSEQDRFSLEVLRMNRKKLEELAAKYTSEDIEIEVDLVDDEMIDGVDQFLNKQLIDLVVMGTSGEQNAQEAFTGNHTEQVIQISACPVISVRDGFNLNDMQEIVLAVNRLEDEQALLALNTLRQLAECFDSHIHLVHVREKSTDDENMETYFHRMAQKAALMNYSVTILDHGDQAEGVIAFTRKIGAGLIAVIKNSKEGIFRIFSNHFSDRLVKEVGRPVFTFNLQSQKS